MGRRFEVAWKPLAFSVVVAMFGAVPAMAQTTAASKSTVTYSKDIATIIKRSCAQCISTDYVAPILQRSCARCHRPDSVAPMPLLNYAQTRPYARAIKQRVQLKYAPWMRGVMPPWYVETNVGIQHFRDDPSLSDKEISMIAAWA